VGKQPAVLRISHSIFSADIPVVVFCTSGALQRYPTGAVNPAQHISLQTGLLSLTFT